MPDEVNTTEALLRENERCAPAWRKPKRHYGQSEAARSMRWCFPGRMGTKYSR